MADLDVVAVLTAKPGSESLMRDALTALVAPTRAEDGCISYDLYASATDPQVFVTVEKWRSQADVDAHMGSAHIQAALASAGDHFGAGPAIHSLSPIVVGTGH
jgi:quinol monooxygenase YgiN